MRVRKPFLALLLACAWGALFDPLLAHVAIFPRTFQAGARHDAFYIRAPVEKDIPVVELGIEVDEAWRRNGGDVADFQEIPGWSQQVEIDEEGKIKKAYWKVLPGNPGTVPQTFQMIWARVSMPDKPGEYPFVAWQKYADGSVVWWNESRSKDRNPENPAPVVLVNPKGASTAALLPTSYLTIALLILAIALSVALLALWIALRNQRKSHS
ncbi:MAG: DUF1775 domain-containing protein [Acidobacteria bacterium]|nr:DUF1775 domain-containing protein [Acidobacteriota bacterium]